MLVRFAAHLSPWYSSSSTASSIATLRRTPGALGSSSWFRDLVLGGRFLGGPEVEQGLAAGQRGTASVVVEDGLVEIALEVRGKHAAEGALQPGLEVRDRAMGARENELGAGTACSSVARRVIKAGAVEGAVALPAVGVDGRAWVNELRTAARPALRRPPADFTWAADVSKLDVVLAVHEYVDRTTPTCIGCGCGRRLRYAT